MCWNLEAFLKKINYTKLFDSFKDPKICGYGGNWLATSLASRHESNQALPKDSRAELTTYLSKELYPSDDQRVLMGLPKYYINSGNTSWIVGLFEFNFPVSGIDVL
jgi:hypothetical protein